MVLAFSLICFNRLSGGISALCNRMLDRLLDMSPTLGGDTLLLLPVLIMLELVLSADNAIALAAIAQGLNTEELQKKALNIGLIAAFVLRVSLILAAGWVLKYWQFEVAGAVYLLWLVYQHFAGKSSEEEDKSAPKFKTLWQAVPTIALTDLAFSLDSVTTAIALSKDVSHRSPRRHHRHRRATLHGGPLHPLARNLRSPRRRRLRNRCLRRLAAASESHQSRMGAARMGNGNPNLQSICLGLLQEGRRRHDS